MAEDLWKLRKRRGMSISQLASKSGVPALSIQEYEQGKSIRVADLSRLANALFVDELDINIQSGPKPAGKPQPSTMPSPTEQKPAEPQPKPKKEPKPQPPAKPTQITHLLELAKKLGQDEAAVQAAAQEAVGKPLDELTLLEARQLLYDYTEQIKAQKAAAVEEGDRPEGTRRKRAHLPEGVDKFELNYLESCRESGDSVTFYLLNGKTFTGRIIGFSPYQITIDNGDGTETTLHKLALAYYTRRLQGSPAGEESA